jgi:CubicO group peptidase (beta-lactamase class C family)
LRHHGDVGTGFAKPEGERVMRMAMMGLAALVGVAAALPAQDTAGSRPNAADLAQLDGFATGMALPTRFSGVVLAARGDKVLFARAYGLRDAELRNSAATVDTRYNLASTGKMFTSVAVWQQIAAGKLKLDTQVGKVLEDFPNKAMRKATVRQLLTHSAGAGDIDLFGVDAAANRERVRTVADMIALVGNRPPTFKPGSKQEYGNFGYVILARMVEVLSGESYEDYLSRHIFTPAGMTRTGFVDCNATAPDLAVGYVTIGGQRRRNCATQPVRGTPAGGQVSTAGDMHRFIAALQAGKLIPAAQLAEAIKPARGTFGLGFSTTGYGDKGPARDSRWGDAGSADGACTDVRTYPVTGETVIVLSNRDAPECFTVANFLHANW